MTQTAPRRAPAREAKFTWTTVSGHEVRYGAPPTVAALIERLKAMLADPAATEDDMIVAVYNQDNPVMDREVIPGRGAVTTRTLANPAYRVMTDLLFRKRLAEGGQDSAALAARYTLTVGEAAGRLGVSRSAIHQAIQARRLSAWVKDGQNYLDPDYLDGFQLSRRGPKSKKRQAARPAEPAAGKTRRPAPSPRRHR